jgi:hypothetical protein
MLFNYTRTVEHPILSDKTEVIFGVCRDVTDLSSVGLAVIFLHSLLFLVRFEGKHEKKDCNGTQGDKRVLDATLVSPVLFASDINNDYRSSANSRFRDNIEGSDGVEIVLRLV